MRRCWWTVWIEVGLMAVLLFFAYNFVSDQVRELFSPYLIEEDQIGDRTDNAIKELVEKAEEKLKIRIDYENMIFDYANKYAQTMMEQSHEERSVQSETIAVVEDTWETENTEETEDTEVTESAEDTEGNEETTQEG